MILLQEWIAREGHLLVTWWITLTLAGVAALPLCLKLLGGLPDKGYTLCRPIGMLLVSTMYWLLVSFGLLENSAGSIVMSWALLLFFSIAIYSWRPNSNDIRGWWRENRPLVLISELLFLGLFIGWAIYRAHQNEIFSTEKPMELAFMSGIKRSASFPPDDPWLSGFSISYYYLGYLMAAMTSMVGGISNTISFNLNIASHFALTGIAAFGVAYNLVRSRAFTAGALFNRHRATHARAILTGIIATLLMTLVGNFQAALIEMPYASRFATHAYLDFWGTPERSHFYEGSYVHDPDAPLFADLATWDFWWWFRAARVLADYNLDGTLAVNQPIDEFPAFSFLLADNHPHVLALPFVLATIGLMLNIVLLGRRPNRQEMLLYGVAVGGLSFLNTWDGPIYLLGLVGAEGLRRMMLNNRGRINVGDLLMLLKFGLSLAVIAFITYLPFIIGFRSQAGGLLPNLVNPTHAGRFFIMFGPQFMLLPGFLAVEIWRSKRIQLPRWRLATAIPVIMFVGLALLMLLLSVLARLDSTLIPAISSIDASEADFNSWGVLAPIIMERRLDGALTSLILLIGIVLVLARLLPGRSISDGEEVSPRVTYPAATGVALLLIAMGLCATLIPEYIVLRDVFSARINTIFKFYYQAWALWSIAGAYGAYSLLSDDSLRRLPRLLRLGYGLIVALGLLMGLFYSAMAITYRGWHENHRGANWNPYAPPEAWENPISHVAHGARVDPGDVLFSDGNLSEASEFDILRADEQGIALYDGDTLRVVAPLSLDGRHNFINPEDYAAIACLSELAGRDDVVVAEAERDSYNPRYGRVGSLHGIPVVLGWASHERQWRGPAYHDIVIARSQNLNKLYTAEDIATVDEVVKQYNISYIMFGETERGQYGSMVEEVLFKHFPVVCESNASRVFAVVLKDG